MILNRSLVLSKQSWKTMWQMIDIILDFCRNVLYCSKTFFLHFVHLHRTLTMKCLHCCTDIPHTNTHTCSFSVTIFSAVYTAEWHQVYIVLKFPFSEYKDTNQIPYEQNKKWRLLHLSLISARTIMFLLRLWVGLEGSDKLLQWKGEKINEWG